MLLQVPQVLTADQVAHCRARLAQAGWADGRITAGYQSAQAKDNTQLPENDPVARELGALVLEALARNSTFFSAALPQRIYPPLFNRYSGGQSFGFHVDNAVRYDRSSGGAEPVRTDLSATLFLSAPVTRGERIASFFWIQSLLREDAQRRLMFDLDVSIRRLTQDVPDHPALVQLTGVYHNLLRRWAET
jgi:PKHD-type hydroxylase